MRTRSQLINLRIVHVTLMLACALFVYQFSQWDDGLWVPISVLAIIGPFRPGLTIVKAKQRLFGTIGGLLLSVILWFIVHYNYNLLIIFTLLLLYALAFSALQNYTYFIMLVSMLLCINFDYLNLFFNSELLYVVNRGMCVLTGVAICQFFECWVFKHSYHNVTSLVDGAKLDQLVVSSWTRINGLAGGGKIHVAQLNQILHSVLEHLDQLDELRESCMHSYSDQRQTLALIEHYHLKLNSLYAWVSQIAYTLLQANFKSTLAANPVLEDAD